MKKTIWSAFVVFCFLLTLCACGGSVNTEETLPETTETPSSEAFLPEWVVPDSHVGLYAVLYEQNGDIANIYVFKLKDDDFGYIDVYTIKHDLEAFLYGGNVEILSSETDSTCKLTDYHILMARIRKLAEGGNGTVIEAFSYETTPGETDVTYLFACPTGNFGYPYYQVFAFGSDGFTDDTEAFKLAKDMIAVRNTGEEVIHQLPVTTDEGK